MWRTLHLQLQDIARRCEWQDPELLMDKFLAGLDNWPSMKGVVWCNAHFYLSIAWICKFAWESQLCSQAMNWVMRITEITCSYPYSSLWFKEVPMNLDIILTLCICVGLWNGPLHPHPYESHWGPRLAFALCSQENLFTAGVWCGTIHIQSKFSEVNWTLLSTSDP